MPVLVNGCEAIELTDAQHKLLSEVLNRKVSTYEAEILSDCLPVLRDGDWLSEFITCECSLFAQGMRRTPTEVLGLEIENQIGNFDCKIEMTKHMLRWYPRFFAEELSKAAKAEAPGQATQ